MSLHESADANALHDVLLNMQRGSGGGLNISVLAVNGRELRLSASGRLATFRSCVWSAARLECLQHGGTRAAGTEEIPKGKWRELLNAVYKIGKHPRFPFKCKEIPHNVPDFASPPLRRQSHSRRIMNQRGDNGRIGSVLPSKKLPA